MLSSQWRVLTAIIRPPSRSPPPRSTRSLPFRSLSLPRFTNPVVAAAAAAAMGASATEDVEFVEYDLEDDDDGMDEDDQAAARALPVPHIATPAVARTRGRLLGRSPSILASSRDRFDSVPGPGTSQHGPQRSIEGWIILVSGVKEDAEESDLFDAFRDFGRVRDLHFNLERRTGYGKGYALVEYESFEEAQTAIKAMNGRQLLTKTIHVDWAFNRGPIQKVISTRPSRPRSRTPPRRLAALTY